MSSNPTKCQHNDALQFACLSQNKLFCKACHHTHSQHCMSSRCGNLKRLNITLSKNIQILKIRQRLKSLGVQPARAQKILNNFEASSINFTNYLIKCMQVQIPQIFYTKMNELFIQLFGGLDLPEKIMNLEAQIQYIIDTDSKSSDYQHFLQNTMNSIRVSEKEKNQKIEKSKNVITQDIDKKIKKIEERFPKWFEKLFATKKYFYQQFKDSFQQNTAEILQNKINYLSYEDLEKFKKAEDFDSYKRYGIDFDLLSLEKHPQSLLTYCKNLLKQQMYNNFVKQKNTGFPYHDCYIISTTSTPNPLLQNILVKMQTKLIDDIAKRINPSSYSQPLCVLTKRIIVLGPQLIDIAINAQKDIHDFKISLKIYCDDNIYKAERQNFLKDLLSLLGLNSSNKSKTLFENKPLVNLKHQSQLNRVYCYFQTAKNILEGKGRYKEDSTLNKERLLELTNKGKNLVKEMTESIKKYKKVI